MTQVGSRALCMLHGCLPELLPIACSDPGDHSGDTCFGCRATEVRAGREVGAVGAGHWDTEGL